MPPTVKIKVKKKKTPPLMRIKADGTPKRTNWQKKTEGERQQIRERQNQALELRVSGATYKDIAATLGFKSQSGAKDACNRAIARVEVDAAKETVSMDLQRLEEMMMRCIHALRNNNDLGQVGQIMRIMEFRYRLMGITDETVRILQAEHGVTGPTSTTNNTNNVMVVHASPETEEDFLRKMMGAVGVDYDSQHAQDLLKGHRAAAEGRPLPLLKGSANDASSMAAGHRKIEDEAIDVDSWEDEEK